MFGNITQGISCGKGHKTYKGKTVGHKVRDAMFRKVWICHSCSHHFDQKPRKGVTFKLETPKLVKW